MSTVFSTQFFVATPGVQGSYTVPTGYVAVLRSVTAANSGASGVASYAVWLDSPLVQVLVGYAKAPDSTFGRDSDAWDLHVVFKAGQMFRSANSPTIYMTASGYLLTV